MRCKGLAGQGGSKEVAIWGVHRRYWVGGGIASIRQAFSGVLYARMVYIAWEDIHNDLDGTNN